MAVRIDFKIVPFVLKTFGVSSGKTGSGTSDQAGIRGGGVGGSAKRASARDPQAFQEMV
jgi:hypothetical protein